MNISTLKTEVIPSEKLTPADDEKIEKLAEDIFGDISEEEIEDDFYAPKFAVITAKIGHELVGYTGLYKRVIEYDGEKILLGGFGGLMTKEDMRGKGIATIICLKALEVFKEEGLDVAFHSIDTQGDTAKFYEKLGYILLNHEFGWKSKKGEIKSDMGGMIRAIKSPHLFQLIKNGNKTFYVGEGYW